MSYVILVRNPGADKVFTVGGDDESDESAAEFDTRDDAEKAARSVPVCQVWPYSIAEAP